MKKITLLTIILALTIIAFGCTPTTDNPNEIPGEIDTGNNEEIEEVVITPVDKVDVENLTLLDEYSIDFDNDEVEEKVAMYTVAGKDSNGEIAWDDGQNWLFVVHDTEKDYVLVDEYVQLGRIDFNIYTIEDDFYIATYSGRTASLTLNLYHYDRENDSFVKTTPFTTTGNVNMLKSSYGY